MLFSNKISYYQPADAHAFQDFQEDLQILIKNITKRNSLWSSSALVQTGQPETVWVRLWDNIFKIILLSALYTAVSHGLSMLRIWNRPFTKSTVFTQILLSLR